MRLPSLKWRWRIGLGLAVLLVAFLVIRTWVVPAVLVAQVEKQYGGRVVIRSWWFGLHSAGVVGVELGESRDPKSPTWLRAERISTDVSIARLARGRVMPTRIEIDRPVIIYRLDAKGQPSTKIPIVEPKASSGKGAKPATLPEIEVKDGEITLQQEGRPPMKIVGVGVRMTSDAQGSQIAATTDDPAWGKIKVDGRFDPTFKNGTLAVETGPGFEAVPDRLREIPFVPAEVWANLEPRGRVDAKVAIKLAAADPRPVQIHTELTLKGTEAKLESLKVDAKDVTGRVVIDDAQVRVLDLRGKTIDGTFSADGLLDFGQNPARVDLDVRLKGIDVTKAPESWQLGEVGATGRLTGKVELKVALAPSGVDLAGTTGEAVIEDGSFQGIPIKSLSLGMKASGGDLQFETMPQGSVDKQKLESAPRRVVESIPVAVNVPATVSNQGEAKKTVPDTLFQVAGPLLAALPILRMATGGDSGVLGWSTYLASELVAFQAQHEPAKARAGGFRLPKTVSTKLELEDVDLRDLIAKAAKFGIKIPVPVAGRFSIKASATIPLGSLRDLKGYAFRGDATLKGASIDHVDIGRVVAHLEFVDGVLDLSDFRGQFIDRPGGTAKAPPPVSPEPPKTGELPPGGFRVRLRAEVEPRGVATAHIEGRALPLGELFAPILPVPTPLSGDLTTNVEARVDLAALTDPKSYTLDGHLESRRIAYQAAILDRVAGRFALKAGRVEIADFAASLAGKPLTASGGLDLAAPYRYVGKVRVAGWRIADVLAFVPGAPRQAPASGEIEAVADADGSLAPFSIKTAGSVRVGHARAGPAPLGNVSFRWATERDVISLTSLEANPFGGKLSGEARVSTKPGGNVDASAHLKGLDSARVSAAVLGKQGLALAGLVDGRVRLAMPVDASTVDLEALLTAPDLRVRRGAVAEPAQVRSVRVEARAKGKAVTYEATADGLGGKLRFHGSLPLKDGLARAIAEAEARADSVRLDEVWRASGVTGGLAKLEGLGAFDFNLRAPIDPFRLWSRGWFEFQDLHYGSHFPLGNARGTVAITPRTWKVEDIEGDLFGGIVLGSARGLSHPDGTREAAFNLTVDRASLHRMMASIPMLARDADGFGSVRIAGRLDDEFRASTEVLVPRARVLGLILSDVRFPGEIGISPESGNGSFHARHWTARVAGGSVMGDTRLRLGEDRSFQTDLRLNDVDLEVLSRLEHQKPASGKLSGKISLSGPHPDDIARMRGKVDLTIDDASLVELPVIKQLDRFLGAARGGGLFEDGELHGTIYNRTLFIDQLALAGRIVQVHVSGTVTFDGGLNLEALINTNQLIPQSGLALINVIPGLGAAIGRSEEVLMRIGAFLSSRLLKFRITGTIKSPSVALDTGVAVGDSAVGFFSGVLKVPGGGR